jgi:hypothetical protein
MSELIKFWKEKLKERNSVQKTLTGETAEVVKTAKIDNSEDDNDTGC